MIRTIYLERKVNRDQIYDNVYPGKLDFNQLIEKDSDGYDEKGNILFKFRKNVVPKQFNDSFPKIADICKVAVTFRSVTPNRKAKYCVIGFGVHNLSYGNFVYETGFTKNQHAHYKELLPLFEHVNSVFRVMFPEEYYAQARIGVDSHFLMGRTLFSQCIINDTLQTRNHRDTGNVDGSLSNMICLGDESFSGGYLVFPEYDVAINIRPRDYIGFMGKQLWHGNTKINGRGTRLSIICYLKEDVVGKLYEQEILKMAKHGKFSHWAEESE